MKLFTCLYVRLRWLHLPGALLIALLQRTPVVRLAALAEAGTGTSPLGAVLRSAFAVTASLGAMHSLAGATVLATTSPTPLSATVGVAIPSVGMTVTGAQTVPGSFNVTGPIPPGLSVSGLTGAGGAVNTATLLLSGTPTTAGAYRLTIRAWADPNLKGDSSSNFFYTVNVAAAASVAPAITTQPASQAVNASGTVTFTAAASGTPAPTLQWRKDGVNVPNATNATLTLTNVQPADAGAYTVVATNSAGSATSNAATLTVNPVNVTLPAFVAQPAAQTIASGSTVVFAASASGATGYQWRKNGVPIAGATRAMLVLPNATAADAGNYSVMAIGTSGAVPSTAAALSVSSVSPSAVGRLINLSILTPLAAGETMTMGTVLGGAGTSGAKALLARAAGPSLAAFGLTGVLPDPTMALIASANGATIAANNDWNGTTALSGAFVQVGAFAYSAGDSKDAAIYETALPPGGYTVQVSDVNGAAGTVIAELYDSTPSGSFTPGTPRLINVSVLKQMAAGSTLTAGFVIGGTTARTVLVRAIGPGLAQFGLANFMADPQLALFASATKISEDDNWGGDPQLTAAGNAVGAFAVSDTGSKDAMLLVTLAPGSYTAQVNPVNGTAGGTAIVEVYEVP